MRSIRIATRASKLALAQAATVKARLETVSKEVRCELVHVSTRGDRDKSDFLYKSESVGLFTSEVENSLLDGRADVAVHSLKDLPTSGSAELVVAAVMKRAAAADALVAWAEVDSIEQLPAGATVGTSSLRRIAQLKHLRADLKCVPLRGNVETRVRKVIQRQVDAAVVACAGLERLGLGGHISAVLDAEQFLPAPAQGALAVQVRAADSELVELVGELNDEPTRIATEAERAVLAAMHGGCSIPLGVYARVIGDRFRVDAMIAELDGAKLIRRSRESSVADARGCAAAVAADLLEAGGEEILKRIRDQR